MSIWFEGTTEINCTLQQVKQSLENLGEHYVGVISLMPGLTSVELVEEGSDFVTLKTNEGIMKRTNIVQRVEADRVVVELDEEYQAGRMVTLWQPAHGGHVGFPGGRFPGHVHTLPDAVMDWMVRQR